MIAGTHGMPTTVHAYHRRRKKSKAKNRADKPDRRGQAGRKPSRSEAESRAEEKAKDAAETVKEAAEQIKSMQKTRRSRQAGRRDHDRARSAEAPKRSPRKPKKGYDLLVIGLEKTRTAASEFHAGVTQLAHGFEGPLAIVVPREAILREQARGKLSILVPVNGTERRAAPRKSPSRWRARPRRR